MPSLHLNGGFSTGAIIWGQFPLNKEGSPLGG